MLKKKQKELRENIEKGFYPLGEVISDLLERLAAMLPAGTQACVSHDI